MDSVKTPWGRWTLLDEGENYKVKRIEVFPKNRLSYQKHFKREEHWVIVKGIGNIILDGREIILKEGEYIDIPKMSNHRIGNMEDDLLIFIEVQMGKYLGEDDIIRIEDDYGRSN
jgi:mannose-6-phosphate isomerase